MRLRVLGALEVAGPDGPRALAATKLRLLLSALAIRRGSVVSTDELIDALWGEEPPASSAKLLQIYVSQLRKLLPAGLAIATRPAGYALEVDPSDVDAARFETYLAEGRSALRSGNAALAAAALARGLALWRGAAYADVRYEPFATDEAERLESLREAAIEDRIEADLRLGRHAEVLGELRGLLAADPTRERLAAQAVLAAYRTGGPTDALSIFATVRDALADELETEPSPELRGLRDRVAARDPDLDLEASAMAAGGHRSDLPLPPNALIGRDRELAELRALVERPGVRLVSLTGAGGSGKSRLALELARELGPTFANGAMLVELAPLHDPDLLPATIARQLGLEPGSDAMDTLSEALGVRELVLVLDNMEHLRAAAPELVRLLSVAPRLVVLVTTRVVLHVSGEHVYPVTPLGESDAVALFAERARALDPTFAPDDAGRALAASICRRVDGLPLAIELAAARVRAFGLRTLDARLASRLAVLTGGPRDLPARQQSLRETVAWSVNLLAPREAEVLAALAVFAGGCTIAAAQAVAGADDDTLTTLVDHNLVQALDHGDAVRFRLLETVREYAYELLGDRRAEVEAALTDWMVEMVKSAALNGLGPPQAASLLLLDAELDNIRDALRRAAHDADPARELALAAGMWRYWWVRGYLAEGRSILESALQRRGLVLTEAGIRTARGAASLAWSTGDTARAEALAGNALAAAMEAGIVIEQVAAHNVLGVIATAQGDHRDGERHLLEAVRLAEGSGNLELAHTSQLNLGIAYQGAGRLDDARARFRAVLEYRAGEGLSEGVGFAQMNLGEVEYAAGNLDAAERHFLAAAEAFRTIGFKARLGNALQGLAAVEARTGRAASAARRLGAAATLMSVTGWRADGSDLLPETVAAARSVLGDDTFEALFAEGEATSSS